MLYVCLSSKHTNATINQVKAYKEQCPVFVYKAVVIVAKPQKCCLAPYRKTYRSRIRRWTVRNSQILVVSAVKSVNNVCKLLPGTSPHTLTWASPLDPTEGLLFSNPMGYSPQMKISGAARVWSSVQNNYDGLRFLYKTANILACSLVSSSYSRVSPLAL